MWKDVKECFLSCDICLRPKNPRHRPYGLLQLLPIPRRPWSSICMDFITDLPPSNSFDSIFVVVDWLTKMAHFVPCKKTSSSKDTTRFFFYNVYCYHGLPDDIESGRGTQFVSKFWRSLFEILKVDIKLFLAFYPQTGDQIEWMNQVLEQYTRCNINYQQDDWTAYLLQAKFAHNNTLYASTQQSPFFFNYEYHVKLNLLSPLTNTNPTAEGFMKQLTELQTMLKLQLQTAQETYKASADKL